MDKQQVIGSRVLIEIERFDKEKFMAEKKFVEGSSLIQAVGTSEKELEDALEIEIASQTTGKIVALGAEAFKRDSYSFVPKIGDIVRFQRYGAVRLANKDTQAKIELWVINDKDILTVQSVEE